MSAATLQGLPLIAPSTTAAAAPPPPMPAAAAAAAGGMRLVYPGDPYSNAAYANLLNSMSLMNVSG